MRDVLHFWKDLTERGSVAAKLVSDNDCWLVLETSQQPLEELLGRFLVTPVRDEDVKLDSVLINRAPQVLLFTFDLEEDLVKVPGAPWPGPSFLDLCGKVGTEIEAPFPDGFIADHDATLQKKIGNIAQAQTKAVIKPHGVPNDFNGEPVARIEAGAHRRPPGKALKLLHPS